MKPVIQFIYDQKTAFLQSYQDDGQGGKQLPLSIGFTGKRQFIELVMQGSLEIKLTALLVEPVSADSNSHVIHHGEEMLPRYPIL